MTKIAVSTAMASLADMTDSAEHHRQRSEFIRGLVQQSVSEVPINDRYKQGPPRIIVQYWHDLGELPGDIEECIASWTHWRTNDFTHCLFDERGAKEKSAASVCDRMGPMRDSVVRRWRTGSPSRRMEPDSHSAPPHDVTRQYVADSLTRARGPAGTSRTTSISDCAQYRC
jgi:hypothetical protein